jgi:hypothetical protein
VLSNTVFADMELRVSHDNCPIFFSLPLIGGKADPEMEDDDGAAVGSATERYVGS